jgi:hypothetical protein
MGLLRPPAQTFIRWVGCQRENWKLESRRSQVTRPSTTVCDLFSPYHSASSRGQSEWVACRLRKSLLASFARQTRVTITSSWHTCCWTALSLCATSDIASCGKNMTATSVVQQCVYTLRGHSALCAPALLHMTSVARGASRGRLAQQRTLRDVRGWP